MAIQERRELYQHRKAQQSKVARLESHMDTVQMVRYLAKAAYHASTSSYWCIVLCLRVSLWPISLSFSMKAGMNMIACCVGTSRHEPNH